MYEVVSRHKTMLQLYVRSVRQGHFKNVAAISSYENGQSTLNMLQLSVWYVRQVCFKHVAAISIYEKWSVTSNMLLPMRTVRQRCFSACIKWSVNIKHVITIRDICKTRMFQGCSRQCFLMHEAAISSYENGLSTLNMLQLSVWYVIQVRQGHFKNVAAISSYENGQSTLNMLQLSVWYVRQVCFKHVAAISIYEKWSVTSNMLLPMRTVRQRCFSACIKWSVNIKHVITIRDICKTRMFQGCSRQCFLMHEAAISSYENGQSTPTCYNYQ